MTVLPALARPVLRRRVAPLVAIFVTAFTLAVAGQASAAVLTVNLDGAATGTVTSSPPGINCSNTGGGAPGPACSFNFLPALSIVELTATPDAPALFTGWTGNAFRSTCNSGSVNPCGYTVAAAATVTATFDPPPDPPAVATTPAASVRPYSAQMKGTVNPGGSPVGKCSFEYGRTENYGKTIDCQPRSLGSGSTDVEVTGYLSRLEPNTTYHYRVTAENAGGISKSDDRTFTTGPIPSDSCPNAAIRAQQRIELPYCMALEMVSPPNKSNFKAAFPSIGADGDAIRFFSLAALGDTESLATAVKGDSYVAQRTPDGWSTVPTTVPPPYSTNARGNPSFFTPDFRRWFAFSPTADQYELGILTPFDGGIETGWSKRDPLLEPIASQYSSSGGNGGIVLNYQFTNASADLSRIFVRPGGGARYLAGDPQLEGDSTRLTYVSTRDSDGSTSLRLLTRDGAGQVWGGNCENVVGGGANTNATSLSGDVFQGAVSRDGRRVFFMARPSQPFTGACDASANRLRLMRWLDAPGGVQISQLVSSECDRVAPACDPTDGDDFFQGASADGTKVYFTTSRQLADSDLDVGSACSNSLASSSGCDLYLFDSSRPPGERLTQVSAGDGSDVTPGAGAKVARSIVAVSGDGSRAYFVSPDILTGGQNPVGQAATAGQPNLYVFHRDGEGNDELSFVATLAAADGGDGAPDSLFGSETSTMRNAGAAVPLVGDDPDVGGDGHILVFQSSAALTADDADGARRDVYRYDSGTGSLERVSKAEPAGDDNGAFDVETVGAQSTFRLGPDSSETSRWVSEDGRTVLFASGEGLVDGNANPLAGLYLWRDGDLVGLPGDGTVGLTSQGGRIPESPRLSRSGDQVVFTATEALLPEDGDIARDVYVARVGGGFPFKPDLPECDALGGDCQDDDAPAVEASRSTGRESSGNVVPGQRPRLAVASLSRGQRAALARGQRVRLRVRSNTAGRVAIRGSARLKGRKRRVLAASRRVPAGRRVTIPLRLSKPARRQLAKTGRLRLRLVITLSEATGRQTATVVLKRPTSGRRGGDR